MSGQKSPRELDGSRLTLRQMLELEGCMRCGECIPWCPTFAEKELDEITPLDKIDRLKRFLKGQHGGILARLFGLRQASDEDLARFSSGVYDCTLCGRCREVCPIGIRTRSLWIGMREQLVGADCYPAVLGQTRDRILASGNILGEDNRNREMWKENIEEGNLRNHAQPEVTYFVGCVASMYPMVYGIPQSLVDILGGADVRYSTLGAEERCCGFPLAIAGMGDQARELATGNVETVRRQGSKILVTTCPSCFHTWAHLYPELIGGPLGFEVVHATQLIARLIREGRLALDPLEGIATYHDPCDLGRASGIFDEPREVLKAIRGLELVEMADNRELALCCGGGGDVEMADPGLSAAIARRRIEQARETGASYLISACQQCKRTLAAAARKEKARLKVLDIVELVSRAQ